MAGRVMARLADQGWVCSASTGTWSLKTLCDALQDDLLAAGQGWARNLHDQLGALPADDDARLRFLGRVLRQHPVLLVLDNFEDHLIPDGAAFTTVATSSMIKRLAESCSVGRLLVTCRYPLPGLQSALRQLCIGPLSPSETRRLFLRLEGLRTLADGDAELVHRLVGGHPRVLEFLDALRRRGVSIDRVRPKLSELASGLTIELAHAGDLREDVAVAVQLGARDVCLDLLLSVLDDAEGKVLLQTAVSSLPVPTPDLSTALASSELDDAAVTRAAQRLADLSLVVQTGEGMWVHRWTAEGLRQHQSPKDYRDRCRRAGDLRLRRLTSASHHVTEHIEATQNFLDAHHWDRAISIATRVADFLAEHSNRQQLSFTARVLAALPLEHPHYHLFVYHEAESLAKLGFTDEAEERYRHLVDLFTQRAHAEPGHADHLRDLSMAYDKLGDLYRALGHSEPALELYQKSLDIADRLVQAEPDRMDYQRKLSISCGHLADLYQALHDTRQALPLYQRYLNIVGCLVQAEPDCVDYQRDLGVVYERLGDLYKASGKGNQALIFYQLSVDTADRLARADPGRAEYQQDLSISYERLASLYALLRQSKRALPLYQKSLDIADRLARAEPDRVDYQRDLSASYDRLGNLYGELGQNERALELYQKSLDIADRLARAEPDRVDYQRDLSLSYRGLGGCFFRLDRIEEAAAALKQHLHLSFEICQRLPGQVDAVIELATALHLTRGLYDDADERNRRAVELLETLEAHQRLPAVGKEVLDFLRRGRSPHPRDKTSS